MTGSMCYQSTHLTQMIDESSEVTQMTQLNSDAQEKTVRLFPIRINPEFMERLYEALNNEGKVELNDFLNAQDLEINDITDGKVTLIPLRYDLIPEKAQAEVVFADGHEEWWQVDFSKAGKIFLIDHKDNVIKDLVQLRPTDDTPDCEKIIEISLVFTHYILGF